MGYKLSIDSGGTKMRAVLFDSAFRLAASGSGGSANANFDSPESIAATVRACLAPCLEALDGAPVERVYMTTLGASAQIEKLIATGSPGAEFVALNEGESGVRAAIRRRSGTIALAGTGSVVFGIGEDGRWATLGGWGSWLGDEGSGFDLGRRAIGAAIRHEEGRGPETAIHAALLRHYGIPRLQELHKVVYQADSPRRSISSAAIVVSAAARGGDPVALDILAEAGREMGELASAMLRRQPELARLPVTFGGSVWKSGPAMYDTFVRALEQRHPASHLRIEPPAYEPVMGGVVEEALRLESEAAEEALAAMETQFADFRYRTD